MSISKLFNRLLRMIILYESQETKAILPALQSSDKEIGKFDSYEDAMNYIKAYLSATVGSVEIMSVSRTMPELIDIDYRYPDGKTGYLFLGYKEV